jgi:GTPase
MAVFLIQDIYDIIGVGAVVVGTVEKGTITTGMRSKISESVFEIKSIEMEHKSVREANEGSKIGISFRRISSNEKIGFFKGLFNPPTERNIIRNYVGKRIEFL